MNARILIEDSLDPLVTINIKGKITDMNEDMANITGLTRPDMDLKLESVCLQTCNELKEEYNNFKIQTNEAR